MNFVYVRLESECIHSYYGIMFSVITVDLQDECIILSSFSCLSLFCTGIQPLTQLAHDARQQQQEDHASLHHHAHHGDHPPPQQRQPHPDHRRRHH